jgi:hypothetical protein
VTAEARDALILELQRELHDIATTLSRDIRPRLRRALSRIDTLPGSEGKDGSGVGALRGYVDGALRADLDSCIDSLHEAAQAVLAVKS